MTEFVDLDRGAEALPLENPDAEGASQVESSSDLVPWLPIGIDFVTPQVWVQPGLQTGGQDQVMFGVTGLWH